MRFEELALPEPLGKGIAEAGFSECTPIQALTLLHQWKQMLKDGQ